MICMQPEDLMVDHKTGNVVLGAGGDIWQYNAQRWGIPSIEPR